MLFRLCVFEVPALKYCRFGIGNPSFGVSLSVKGGCLGRKAFKADYGLIAGFSLACFALPDSCHVEDLGLFEYTVKGYSN